MSSDPALKDSMIEGHSFKLRPAPVFHRGMAAMIDMGIVTAFMYVLFIVGALFVGIFAVSLAPLVDALKSETADMATVFFFVVLVGILLMVVIGFVHYFYINAEYKTGQTPGKKFMGLKVVSLRNGGGKITLRQAIVRDLARWYIDMLLFLPALIAMAVTKKRQRVGDLIGDTMVVYSEKDEQEQTFLFLMRRDYEAIRSALGPVRLSSEASERFLGFSNKYYLVGNPELTASMHAQADEWNAYLRKENPTADRLGLDANTLLRYVAEVIRRERGSLLSEAEKNTAIDKEPSE